MRLTISRTDYETLMTILEETTRIVNRNAMGNIYSQDERFAMLVCRPRLSQLVSALQNAAGGNAAALLHKAPKKEIAA